ncbi:hypothetical protein D3C81_2097120 [compost metagenome]
MPCNHKARPAKVRKAAKMRNSTTRERHAGNLVASTGFDEKGTPLDAAVRDVLRVI